MQLHQFTARGGLAFALMIGMAQLPPSLYARWSVPLFAVVVLRSLRLARLGAEAGMPFHACMAAAFGVWLAVQAFVNIGVNMGLLPTKGLTLPLMSYGRSSLLVTLAWLGIVMRIHHEVMASGRVPTDRGGP